MVEINAFDQTAGLNFFNCSCAGLHSFKICFMALLCATGCVLHAAIQKYLLRIVEGYLHKVKYDVFIIILKLQLNYNNNN